MLNIVVQRIDSKDECSKYRVEVVERNSKTTHEVELSTNLYQDLTDGKVSPEELIQCSFEFLLDREPKESILRSFDLSVISLYFPEYSKEIIRYF